MYIKSISWMFPVFFWNSPSLKYFQLSSNCLNQHLLRNWIVVSCPFVCHEPCNRHYTPKNARSATYGRPTESEINMKWTQLLDSKKTNDAKEVILMWTEWKNYWLASRHDKGKNQLVRKKDKLCIFSRAKRLVTGLYLVSLNSTRWQKK